MIATEQTKWFTEGGIPSNGQVVGVHVAGVQTSEDDPASDQVYDLFQLRADQVVLKLGAEVRTASDGAGTFNILVGSAVAESAIPTDTVGVTEASAITIGAGVEDVVKVEFTALPDNAATTLDISVWAIVADISNPTSIRTTVATPAP